MNKARHKSKRLQSWRTLKQTQNFGKKWWSDLYPREQFKAFQHSQTIHGPSKKLTQSIACPFTPRNARYISYGLPTFFKSITTILASLAWFNDIFVIIDVFLTCLDCLIGFLRLIRVTAMARVWGHGLGFLDTGKIGLHKGYHRTREVKTIWLV